MPEFRHHQSDLQKEVSPKHYTLNKVAEQEEHGSGNAHNLCVKEINHRSRDSTDQEPGRLGQCSLPGRMAQGTDRQCLRARVGRHVPFISSQQLLAWMIIN